MNGNGVKEYKIVINGIEQSTTQVDALLKRLDQLDKRLADLGGKESTAMADSIKETSKATDELTKKRQKLAETISGERDEILKTNQILKDATNARQIALAAQRLEADEYGNTLSGLRLKLSDIKKAMTELDVNSNEFEVMQKAAGDLNKQLLELEKGMGVFNRNVGNYKSAAEGFKNVTVAVGGVNREFSSVRDATKQLEAEIKALSLAGKEDTQEFKDLTQAYYEFDKAAKRAASAVNDLKSSSQGMDKMLDFGQSFGALGQVSQGFSAFFGVNNEFEKTLRQLVGLQNAMKGLETLQKQINTGEGLGAWLKKSNEGVDSFVNKLFGVKPAVEQVKVTEEQLAASAEGAATANNALAASEGAVATGAQTASVNVNALSTSQKVAAGAAKALGVAIKAIGIGILLQGVMELKEAIDPLMKRFIDFQRELLGVKNVIPQFREEDERLKTVIDAGNESLDNRIKYIQTLKSIGSITESEANEMEFVARIEDAKEAIERLKEAAGDSSFGKALNDKFIHPTEEVMKRLNEAFDSSGRDVRSWSDKVADSFKKMIGQEDSLSKDSQYILAQFSKRYSEAMKVMEVDTAKGTEAVKQLYKEAMNNDLLNSLLNHPELWIDDEGTVAALNRMWNGIQGFVQNANNYDPSNLAKTIIERYKTPVQRLQSELKKLQEDATKATTDKQKADIQAAIALTNKAIEEEQNKAVKTIGSGNKKIVDTTRELYRLRIDVMKEGLSKTLAQLNLQRDEELAKWKGNAEAIALVNQKYDQKIYDAKKEHFKRLDDLYNEQIRRQADLMKETNDIQLDTQATTIKGAEMSNDESIVPWGTFDDEDVFRKRIDQIGAFYGEMLDMKREYNKENKNLSISNLNIEHHLIEEEIKDDKSQIEDMGYELERLEAQMEEAAERGNFNLVDTLSKEHTKLAKIQTELVINTGIKEANEIDRYAQQKAEIKLKHRQNDIEAAKEYYNALEQEYRDYINYTTELQSKAPVFNNFGIVNLNKTKENYRMVKKQFEEVLEEINQRQLQLEIDFKYDRIDSKTYDNELKELKNLQNNVENGLRKVHEDSKDLIGEFVASINQYIQVAGQSIQQLLSSLWNADDQNHQAMMEQLNDQIAEYEDKQQKLEDITRTHADNINSIEDKLATARGDRREHLIDQLNYEMEAKRKALAEEKKNQQELDKLKEKADEEDLKQKKKQKQRDLTSAIISAALATANGYATKPFLPNGLIYGSIAAALGAAQVAIIANTKYANGGVIEGASHEHGGVKVLGGRAEVEGGEYITNKKTTAQNVDVLDFINSKRRRLNINDFVEFYGTPAKKNLTSLKTKFATGGQIPSLSEIGADSRLLDAFEAYANRPVVVSIVDIIDKEADVQNVRVLAGL